MSNHAMIIGLTGGIASGKSSVSAYLTKKGFTIIDADKVAKDIMNPGSECLEKVISAFGIQYLLENGELNRRLLGQHVFADKPELEKLNSITKPFLLDSLQSLLQKPSNSGIVFLDCALLLDDPDYRNLVDKVVLVHISYEKQLDRLMKRNGYSEEEAINRIQSQISENERMSQTDYMIDNNGTWEETSAQISALIEELKKSIDFVQ